MRKTISCLLALCLLFSAVPAAGAGDSIPSPTEAYNIMIALKDKYPERTPWTNSNEYKWKGGIEETGAGCVAFAYILSDAVFNDLPARKVTSFSFEDVKAGDVLRMNNQTHSIIVLRVFEENVEAAEGNYHENGSGGYIHWGRILSKEEIMANTDYILTRYPEGYTPGQDPDTDGVLKEGSVGTGLRWKLTKAGTLTISGSGAIPDFASTSDCPWDSYRGQIMKIVLEEGVTAIGANAFRETGITSISIPQGVERIGDSAFSGCMNLTTANVPASVVSVGGAAFFQCTKLKSVTFASGTEPVTMGASVFTNCYALSSVTLPQKTANIGDQMFMNCHSLTSMKLPGEVSTIGESAFSTCRGLTYIVIPASVGSIGTAAFSSKALKDIYYGGSEAQWESISRLAMIGTENVTVHYNDPGPEDPTPPTDNTDPTPPTDNTDPTPPTDNTDPTPPTDPVKPPSGGNSSSGRPSVPSVPAGATETTLKPSVSGGGVSAQVRQETMDRLLSNAAEQSRDEIVLKVDAPDGVSQIKTQLPAPALADMAGKTDLVIETPVGRTTLPKDTLAQLGGDSGTVSLTAAADGENGVTIELRRGEDPVGTLPGGMKLELPLSQPGPGMVAVLVDDSGKETILPKSAVQDDGSIAVLLEQGCASLKLEDRSRSFADADGHWAKDAIAFVSSHALFQGVTEDRFQADAPMSRGMLVTVLYRLEQTPAAGNVPFADVPADSYYADAAAWAAKQGIVTGDNAGFSGQRSVTREELAVMLYRYVRHIQGDQGVISGDLPDGEAVSDWAVPAMRWAVSAGILQGDADGTLNPGGTATRGQTAQMLMHFVTQLTR